MFGVIGPVTLTPANKALTMMWVLGVNKPHHRKHLAQNLARTRSSSLITALTNPGGSLNLPTQAHWEVLPPCGDA